ncbi:MAG TPA: phosphatidate cytidylyltransferase [Bacteroidia bacterium]|jgi:phosphatidate cytidylyltransferase|nr:phosphatidate cytidylyltransferase [Bacteroidia bacterium]
MSNFWKRAITGALFLVVMIGGIVWNYWSFYALFFIISMLGLAEFYKLLSTAGIQPQKWVGIIIGALIFLLVVVDATLNKYMVFALAFPFIASIFFVELYREKATPFQNIALTILGLVYVLMPFAAWVSYLYPARGIYNYHLILGYFVILWTNDTGAYLTGSAFGRHKLWERISPKKTWEGFIGGLLLSMGVAYLLSHYYTELNPILWVLIGFIVSVFGTLGDLVESMFKRSIDVKESGGILPGHGGILDRFDGVLLSTPFVIGLLYIVTWINQMINQ